MTGGDGIDIDLIKLDIKGYELKTLKGAKRIIKEQNPNLMVSVYRCSNHATEIIDKVLEYNSTYYIHCIHHPSVIHEVEYCFINKKTYIN